MAKSSLKRIDYNYLDGCNSSVSDNLAKKQEFYHTENARSVVIGTVEKRGGTMRLANSITATANYGIFFFENDGNNGFYRISTVSGVTSIYYINGSDNWTALATMGTSIFEVGTSTTQFDITNPSSTTFRYTYNSTGTDPDIDYKIRIGSSVVIAAQNFTAGNNGTFTVTGVSTNYFEVTNASGVVESNKTIGTGTITVSGNNYSTTVAEGCCFLVNGNNQNIYLDSTGTGIRSLDSSLAKVNHLWGSPVARKINYYKDKLYIADYVTTTGTRYKNSVMMSSNPLGLVALVDGDPTLPLISLNVTDTKYIRATDTLDVYRGGSKVGVLTVTAKTEDTLTATIVYAGAFADVLSSDELWVEGSYNGTRYFRWADNPSSGTDDRKYDTFKVSGDQNGRIKMIVNLGDNMFIGTDNNISVWNDTSLRSLDVGVGCVSDYGYIVHKGALWFIGWDGFYYITPADFTPKLISSPIQRIFDGATKSGKESASVGKKGNSVFISLGTVTLYNVDGSLDKTMSNVVVEYDILKSNWYIHTGLKVTQFATYRATTDPDKLEFSSTETGYHVYEFLTGKMDDLVTSNNPIPFRVDLPKITLGDTFESICSPQQIIIETERGSAIKCFVSLDGEPFYELDGETSKGVTILKVNSKNGDVSQPPRCRNIQISLREFTKKTLRLKRLAILYSTGDGEENNRE